jgi:alpha-N-arabinofuranosidase
VHCFDPNGAQEVCFPMPAVPYLKLAAMHDDKTGILTLFALNRSLTEEMPLNVRAEGFARLGLKQALQHCDKDLHARNSKADPDRITPAALGAVRVSGNALEATLSPASWNVIRLDIA